jgi:ABC-type phosphate transport system permease subunit
MGLSAAAREHRPEGAALIARGLAAWLCAIAVVAIATLMVVSLARAGYHDLARLISSPSNQGIGAMLASSILLVAIALPPTILIAFCAAAAAAERPFGGGAGTMLNDSLRVGPSVPSVAVGLAALTLFTSDATVRTWAQTHPIFAAAAALAALNLPIMAARFRSALRAVPRHWRIAATAAGASPGQVFFGIVAPRAAPGIVAVVLAGMAQMFGETAVVAIVLVSQGQSFFISDPLTATPPLTVGLWHAMTSLYAGPAAAVAASMTLVLVSGVVALRFVARVLQRRRRRVGAFA